LKAEQAFQPDLAELERLITPNTKLVSLTHPNNPTGSMISQATLEQAIRLAESSDTYLLFDETYRELAFGERLPGAASLSPKVISISSMSKSYGLPGIRIGWLATQAREILESVLAIREQVTITNGALSEAIALSVLKRKDEFIQEARRHVQTNLQMVKSWMKQQEDLAWIPPEAGVVALPWIEGAQVTDPEDVYRRLTETYRSFVIPGRCFELDNRFFRLGYGGTAVELKAGLANISSALQDVKR
jgi:aspartate/methionine/tyrosine aminotransferase